MILRGKLSYILKPQLDDFTKFPFNLDAEQFVLGIRIQSRNRERRMTSNTYDQFNRNFITSTFLDLKKEILNEEERKIYIEGARARKAYREQLEKGKRYKQKIGTIYRCGNSWTIEGRIRIFNKQQSKLDWSKFRRETGTKYPLPRQNCRMARYAIRALNLSNSYFAAKSANFTEAALVLDIMKKWEAGNKNPQIIIDNLTLITIAKYKNKTKARNYENMSSKLKGYDQREHISRRNTLLLALIREERDSDSLRNTNRFYISKKMLKVKKKPEKLQCS
jgi:hypothetical protein